MYMKKRRLRQSRRRGQSGEKRDERGLVSMALRYAEANIAVVPIHGTKDGRCTCGDPTCDQPGAHPRAEHDVFDASVDPLFIKHLWRHCPNAEIGIPFGDATGLVGLAIDGQPGRRHLRELIERNANLRRTVTILHLDLEIRLFRSDGSEVAGRKLADGLRILGDGDFIIAPSSLQAAFPELTRFVPDRGLGQVKIARAPRWLLESAAKVRSAASIPPVPVPTPAEARSVVILPASEIKPEKVSWIWPGVIASGGITGLVGHPGLGKSHVSIDVAAIISTGRPWPGGPVNTCTGSVIILSAEDAAAHTVVPRLIAAGADLDAVHIVKAVRDDDGVERPFSLAADLERLEREHDLKQVRLLIVDPITGYLGTKNGTINRNQGSRVRPLLDRLTAFAARHDLGVLAISHLTKARAKAITLVMGSLDWVAVPRAMYVVTEEAETSRRLLLPLKNNLATDRIGFAFELESKVVGDGIQTSAVTWSDDPVTITADEALAAAAKKVSSGAVDFLREALSEGPVDQSEIIRRGEEQGLTPKILRTAREKLGVTSEKQGFGPGGKWVLSLVVDNDKKPATDKKALDATQNDNASAPANSTAEPEAGDEPLGPNGPRRA